jgi:catechol 2,3-dioxygenase-like lactoylglutathione lyase family enzyme
MPTTGSLAHIDISVGYPQRSIPFYHALLTALGYKRWKLEDPQWSGPNPTRATWSIRNPDRSIFGIEVRPAYKDRRDRRYDRYEPGPHHIAFNADSAQTVRRVHEVMVAVGAEVLDPPADYGESAGYSPGYYAVFFADPDGQKLEVAHIPREAP